MINIIRPAVDQARPPPSLNATVPPFEYDLTEHPIRDAITEESFDVVNGRIAVPTAPGLGVTVDEDAVERSRAE